MKNRLHEAMQQDHDLTQEDMEKLNPTNSRSISTALEFIQNPVRMCEHVYGLIKKLNERIKIRKEDQKTKGKWSNYLSFIFFHVIVVRRG